MYDVITMGSATVDVFACSKSKLIKIFDAKGETDLLAFQTGSKVLIDKLVYTVGGGGTNSAAAFAKLGLNTAFMGKIGKNANSRIILDKLKEFNIDTSLIKRSGQHTGFSIVLDNIEKDRVILAYKGVNENITLKDISLRKLKAKWLYSSSLIKRSYITLKKVSSYAKERGIKVAFNPSSYQVEKGMDFLTPVLKNTTALIFNRSEAARLTGQDDIRKSFIALHAAGPEIIVITDGENGVHASDGKKHYFLKARAVRGIMDTTGAGDSFASAFVTGMIKNKSMEFCLKLGLENASSVITHIGAKNGLLSWSRAIAKVRQNKTRIKKSALK